MTKLLYEIFGIPRKRTVKPEPDTDKKKKKGKPVK